MRGSAVFLVAIAACGASHNDTNIPDQCNPLGGQGCLLPWPSMIYTKPASTASGIRLALPQSAMPTNADKSQIDPTPMNSRWDGFSRVGPMLAQFPNGVSATNLPPFSDPDKSLAADSPIVLVDMDTGERAPFFAEVDQNRPSPHGDLIIRPLARLHGGARYAVGIRNTVLDASGAPLVASPGFAALRDGKPFHHPLFATLEPRYEAIFAALATAGVTKNELVLAWDFVTATDDMLTADLLAMRAAALPAMGANGANLTFTVTEQPAVSGLLHRYVGTLKSPSFLTDPTASEAAQIARDGTGAPMLSGTRDANIAAIVPSCVTTQPGPHPAIVFGHGLFGSAKDYLNNDLVVQLAEQHCMTVVAGDFIGLTTNDLPYVVDAVNDFNLGAHVSEKLAQSIIDFMSLETATRTTFAASPQFSFNNQPVIDPAHVYYVGGSLGGIMGNVFMAYDPNITQGVLAVPGGNWSMLIERSVAWNDLQPALMASYADLDVHQILIAMLGMALEPYDAITTAEHVLQNPLPNTPVKNILIWYGLGDCYVSNITTEMVARTMGIQILAPSVKSPWNLTPMAGPMTNGVNVFDRHDAYQPPTTNVPPAMDNGTHGGVNTEPAALRLAFQFILQSTITPQCGLPGAPAPCDCNTGACN
jgi:hypothetical protein